MLSQSHPKQGLLGFYPPLGMLRLTIPEIDIAPENGWNWNSCLLSFWDLFFAYFQVLYNMGVSNNGGTPKWRVYNGKPENPS